ncbi:MAG: hypothetical protein JXR44_02015 [Thiotrichales bacterium]|nr:hypothetical protein [Thiotrichales bacterium]
MKNMTLKALFISAALAVSANAQAEDVYAQCLADAEMLIAAAKKEGSTVAKGLEQKTTVEQCYAEVDKIEAKYGDKTRALNPYSVMTSDDRLKWAKIMDAIDAKKFSGTRFLMAAYYR